MTLQPEALVWPDAAAETVTYLKTKLDPAVRVAIDLTGWRRPQPSVQIHQRGGRTRGVLSMARIQIDARHNTIAETRALISHVRAYMLIMPLEVPGFFNSEEYVGIQVIADADRKPRMMLTWDLSSRGTAL